MRSISATEAGRHLSEVLDAVEGKGERFLILRRGRVVARLEPAAAGLGRAVKEVLRGAPKDADWRADLDATRAALNVQERRWND
jgi:prevent-host-death family protein